MNIPPESIDELWGDGRAWRALGVLPRYEKIVARTMAVSEPEVFLPLRVLQGRGSRRISIPLIPGYVLCRTTMRKAIEWMAIPEVTHVVFADGMLEGVLEDDVSVLRSLADSGLASEPWPYSGSGERVCARHAAFPGVEGELVSADGGYKLIVPFALLERALAVDVDPEAVEIVRIAGEFPERVPS